MKRCARTLRHTNMSFRFTIDRSDRKICLNLESCSSLFKSERDGNQSAARYHGIMPTKKTSKGQEGTNDKGAILLRIIIPWSLFQICSSAFKSATLSDFAILIHAADAKG